MKERRRKGEKFKKRMQQSNDSKNSPTEEIPIEQTSWTNAHESINIKHQLGKHLKMINEYNELGELMSKKTKEEMQDICQVYNICSAICNNMERIFKKF
jgi:hypothetical protein